MDLKIFYVIFLFLSPLVIEAKGNGLSPHYYSKTCPQLEKIVRDEVKKAHKSDHNTPAALLRIVFHDCVVGGCDGSLLLDIKDKNHQQEFDSPKNFGIRNRNLFDKIKAKVELVCPQKVSCADLVVLAGRDSVAITGGPNITVPLGRKDTPVPRTLHQANRGLPNTDETLQISTKFFAQKVGMTMEEHVAIVGAHTLGVTHCNGMRKRLWENATVLPPGKEANFVKYLKKKCPEDDSNRYTTKFRFDPTPLKFDNRIYKNILNGRGMTLLEAEFGRNATSLNYVKKYAEDKKAFFKVFSKAFVKLSSLDVLTGDKGIIRKKCSVF